METIAERSPRILAVWGPAGYRKNALLRGLAARMDRLVICTVPAPAEGQDLSRAVLEALVSRSRTRAARWAAGRLAQPREFASMAAREALRREWPLVDGSELFVLRDVGGSIATPAGLDLVEELVASLPAGRTLAVTTRISLPPALTQIVDAHRSLTITPAELALSRNAVDDLARQAGLSQPSAEQIYEIAHGWPLVSRLLIRLVAAEPSLKLEMARSLTAAALLAFAAHRTVASLEDSVRDAVAVSAVLHGATQLELMRVLGGNCDDVVFSQLLALPFVELEAERAIIHPEIACLMLQRFRSVVIPLYEQVLHALSGDGAYAEAARIAVDGGDIIRAAAILDAAPPYTAARVPLEDYERVLDRLDRDLVTRFPNVWLATIPYRAFSVDRATYIREAETVYYCLPRTATDEQRAVVLIHLASAYANVGRASESDQLLEEALNGFAHEPSSARATLLTFSATLRGIEGRFVLARAQAAEAASISAPDFVFGENQTLHYIEAHEAAFRGRYGRSLVMFDELMRRMTREDLPLYLAYAATNGAFIAWISGDDERFERYVSILEDRLTPGIERGFAPMVDAARGRVPQIDERYPWPVLAAIAHLYRVGEASVESDALSSAWAAVHAADERRDPYAQIFAHTAVFVLDRASRAEQSAKLLTIANSVESPELQFAIRELIAEKGQRGF
ncbi:MAG: hypothetical protein JO036_17540 [Candidatus Eremiobacteraeota bacterium]|nr:hypothetical protein [Candidatus Eremiobacteraeota bacterium]